MQSTSNTRLERHLALVLILFQGHDLSLSLAEMCEQIGLRKSDVLRVMDYAEHQGDVVQVGAFVWKRGTRGQHFAQPRFNVEASPTQPATGPRRRG